MGETVVVDKGTTAMEECIVVDRSISLNLISRVIKMIGDAPYFAERNARVQRIEVLPGGLTNYNFKVTVDGVTYALRVAGDGTIEYLDRKAEYHNASIMSDMNINAKIYYYNVETGDQICKYVDNCKTLHIEDFHNEENLRSAAKIFSKYHNCGKRFLTDFDPVEVTEGYNDLLIKKNAELFEGYDKLAAKVMEIKKLFEEHPQPTVPCHNDPLPENFLVNETGMYLIDWEYSGNNDPMFDLGDFSIENNLSRDEEVFLLTEYFGRKPTWKEYGVMVMHKFLCDALWAVWALLQIATGKPREQYWPYGLNRFNRALDLMNDSIFDQCIQAIRAESKEIFG